MKRGKNKEKTNSERRRFVKTAALSALALLGEGRAESRQDGRFWKDPREIQGVEASGRKADSRVVHSVCLGCNARCGNRMVVKDGRLEGVEGNPYHPYNSLGAPINYSTPAAEAMSLPSPVCGKAIEAPEYVYSPYRILQPLKRAGRRGEGKFEPIEWDQLIKEIAFGGRLFAHLGEDRRVAGLKDLDSDAPVDPRAPELGPLRNAFVFMTGRLQHGRKAFIDRFVKNSFGSINRVGHTDICGLGFRMGNFIFTEGKQVELKADPWGAEYILVLGANIYSALQPGVNTYGAAVAKRYSENRVRFTVVDPRGHEATAHADAWIPIKPGQDGAFAMGMIRWIIENRAYNMEYLCAPNAGEARALGNSAYVNATHLVITDPGHPNYRKFLRMSDLRPDTKKGNGDAYVVLSQGDGHPVPFNEARRGCLDEERVLIDAQGRRIAVKTAFRLMKQGAMEYSLEEYAGFAGVERALIEQTAREFSSHAPRAAVCQYHGAGNYVCGTYAAYAVAVLNALVGSVETRGGYMSSGGGAATWKKGLFDLKNFPQRRRPGGIRISRAKAAYENTTEFKRKKATSGTGYPARRPWFPFTKGGLCVETLSGIDQQYPYGCKALFTYFFNPVYSIPGGYRFRETLADPDKVPLHVSIDVGINESNLYADYIVPDVTYAEGHYGWLSPHAPALKFTGIRTPCIEPLTGQTEDGRPFCLETFLIDLASAIGLPGFGDSVIPDSNGGHHSLHRAEEFYLRGFANIACNAGLPEAAPDELGLVERNYPVARHKNLLPESAWKKTAYMLARGGIFKTYEDVFEGNLFRHGLERVVLYNERLAVTKNSLSGEYFPGTLKYLPPADSLGRIIDSRDRDYPFHLVTYKLNIHTQSRTVWHLLALEILPENRVLMHEEDAGLLGLKNGDRVRLLSRGNPRGVQGRLKTARTCRKGCVCVSFHYGHTQLGASSLMVKDGNKVFLGGEKVWAGGKLLPDPAFARGLNPNYLSNLDESLGDTPMVDLVGGIPDFSTTRVRVVRDQ